MNLFYKFLYFLQGEMVEPKAFGWFHLLWILFVIVVLFLLYKNRDKYSERQLKMVLGTYGIVALILEVLKQLIWSFNFDPVTNLVTWDYQWYAAPFQLCTTPIYVSLICLFLKDGKLRNALLSYMSFVTILGSITTIILPDSCLVSDILVNIHTMYLHMGSFVVSVYLLMSGVVKINLKNIRDAFFVFLTFVLIALALNLGIYHSGILNGETFDMFYISPYFISTLPIFDVIQESLPYPFFFMFYLAILLIGALVIYFISCGISYLYHRNFLKFNNKNIVRENLTN